MMIDLHRGCCSLLADVLLRTLPLPAVAQNPPVPTLTFEELATKTEAKAA